MKSIFPPALLTNINSWHLCSWNIVHHILCLSLHTSYSNSLYGFDFPQSETSILYQFRYPYWVSLGSGETERTASSSRQMWPSGATVTRSSRQSSSSVVTRWILSSDLSILVTWPEYWSMICYCLSGRDPGRPGTWGGSLLWSVQLWTIWCGKSVH